MSQYPLRLPDSLMAAAKKAAEEDHVSMNQLFASAIAEKISALNTEKLLRQRAERADFDAFERVMAKIPHAKPLPGDEIEE